MLPRLQTAVRLPGAEVPARAASTIRKFAPFADVVRAVAVEATSRSSVLDAYLQLDRRFLRMGLDPYAVSESQPVEVHLFGKPEDAAAAIADAGVDLVLDFTIEPESVLPSPARLGTWSVRLGAPDVRDVTARAPGSS